MATTRRTTYEAPPLSGPGLIYSTSRIIAPALTAATFDKWYSEVHIPDVIATGAIRFAARWRCADEGGPDPYLALYKVGDLAQCLNDKFKAIPMSHELLPGGEAGKGIHESADFDTRFYSLVEVFEKQKHDEGEQ